MQNKLPETKGLADFYIKLLTFNFYYSPEARNLSASIAAIQPVPAAVMAWRKI